MNRYQKIAWMNLALIGLAAILTSVVMAVELKLVGYSQYSLFCLAVLIPLKFTPLMFKKPEAQGGVVVDERDDQIVTKALAVSLKVCWWCFFIFSILVWYLVGPENSVSVTVIPLLYLLGAFFFKAACSVAILVLYGKGAGDGE